MCMPKSVSVGLVDKESFFVKKVNGCNIGKHGVTLMKWCNFLILNDSTCQVYYKVNSV